MADQGGFNVKVTAQDMASSVIEGVGRSIGTVATEVVQAQQKIAELKKLIQDNPDKPGFLAGLSAELDTEIPKLQALQAELKQVGQAGTTAMDGANDSTLNWSGSLSEVRSILGAFGIATTLAGIVQFGETIVADIGKIEDLHEATGIASVDLQRLGYIGQGVDVSMDQMGRAVETLATRLSKGDHSAVGAIQDLGLSVEELKKAGPLELFIQSAEAAGRLSDPLDKAGAASELFGDRLGKKLLPMLADMRTQMAQVPEKALIPDDDIKAIDDLADAWKHAKTEMEAYFAKKVISLVKPTPEELASFTRPGPSPAQVPVGHSFAEQVAGFSPTPSGGQVPGDGIGSDDQITHIDKLNNRLKALRTEAMEPLSAQQKKDIIELKSYGENEDVIAGLVRANTLAVHLYVEAHREEEQALKKTNAENERLAKAQADAGSSMSTLSGAQIEAIKYYKEQGLSIAEIAKVLEIYEHQVKQVETAETELAKARKEELDVRSGITLAPDGRVAAYIGGLKEELSAFKQNQTVEEGMRQQHDDKVRQMTLSLFDYQRSKVDEWQNVEEGKLNYSVDGWQKAYGEIALVAKDKYQDIAAAERLALAEMHAQELTWANEFNVLLENAPKNIVSALTGGGGLKGALDATMSQVGGDIGGKLFAAGGPLNALGGKIAQGAGKLFGSGFGDAVGLALPGIGQLAGALIGPLINKLFSIGGPSQAEVAGRKLEASFEQGFGGFDKMMTSIGTAYAVTGRTAAQAQADVKALLEAERQGPEAAQAWIDKLNGVLAEQQALTNSVKSDLTSLPTDLNNIITAGLDPQMAAWDALKQKIDDWKTANNQAVEAATGNFTHLASAADQAAEKARDKTWVILMQQQGDAAAAAKGELADLGVMAESAFAVALASGKSFTDAVAAAGPGLDSLIKAYHDLGITSDDAFVNVLMTQEQIAKANPTLLKGVSSLGPALKGMADLGMLNVDTFGSMERSGYQMYVSLQNEVAKTGGSTKDALLPMQDFLHQAADQAKLLGIPLDANTQMLIDQSKELGVWKDKGKSSMDIMTDAVKALVDKMTLFLEKLGLIPPEKTIDININENTNRTSTGEPATPPGDGGPPSGPDPNLDSQVPGFSLGTPGLGFMNFGGGTIVKLHGEEAVIPKDSISDFVEKNIGPMKIPGGSTSTPADNPYANDFSWWMQGGDQKIQPVPLPGGIAGGGVLTPLPDSEKTIQTSADVKALMDLIRQLLEMAKQGQAPTPVTIQTMLDDRVVAESTIKLGQKNMYGLGDQLRWIMQQGQPS